MSILGLFHYEEGQVPAKRLSMRKIKEVLRFKWVEGLSEQQIAVKYPRRSSKPGKLLTRSAIRPGPGGVVWSVYATPF